MFVDTKIAKGIVHNQKFGNLILVLYNLDLACSIFVLTMQMISRTFIALGCKQKSLNYPNTKMAFRHLIII